MEHSNRTILEDGTIVELIYQMPVREIIRRYGIEQVREAYNKIKEGNNETKEASKKR